MLAITVTLLFGFAAFAALGVLGSSLITGARRVRGILVELAEIERKARVTRARSGLPMPRVVLQTALAAA